MAIPPAPIRDPMTTPGGYARSWVAWWDTLRAEITASSDTGFSIFVSAPLAGTGTAIDPITLALEVDAPVSGAGTVADPLTASVAPVVIYLGGSRYHGVQI